MFQAPAPNSWLGRFIDSLPYWLVFPIFFVLVGGFIGWGEYSGGTHMKVEDDPSGMAFFLVLVVVILFLLYGMFVRLDEISYPNARRELWDHLDKDLPAEAKGLEKRHRTSWESPW